MTDKPLIENIAESIKSYFSISGVIVIGVYMVHNAESAAFGLKILNLIGGFLAIIMGSIIGVWYSFHMFHKLLHDENRKSLNLFQGILYGSFVFIAFIVIITIILGSVTSSCGVIFK